MSTPVYCAGPHVSPVQLGTVAYDPSIPAPADHAALCGDCGAVYAAAVTAPETIPDPTTGKPIPNPDHGAPGHVPTAQIVAHQNKAKDPTWTPPPHNYKTPPGQA